MLEVLNHPCEGLGVDDSHTIKPLVWNMEIRRPRSGTRF